MTNPLSELGIKLVEEIPTEKFIEIASKVVATPELIILFTTMSIVFLIIGMILVKPEGRGKMAMIWFFGTVISLVVLLIIIYNPNVVYNFVNSVKTAIGNLINVKGGS